MFSVTAMRGTDVAASLAGLGVEKGVGRRRKRRQGRTNLQGDDTATRTPLNLVKAKDMIGREEPMEQVGLRTEFVHAVTEQHDVDGALGAGGWGVFASVLWLVGIVLEQGDKGGAES